MDAPISPPDPSGGRAPARWLVVALVILLCLVGLLADQWAERERSTNGPSAVSGTPGFAVSALPDPSEALAFGDVLARSADFIPGMGRREKGHERVVWYRLTVTNSSDDPRHAILGISNDYTQEAILYEIAPGGLVRRQRTGGTLTWAQRSVPAQKPAFAVDLPPHASRTFYVRVNESLKQPEKFLLWNDDRVFRRQTEIFEMEFVGYFSLWIGLLAYNGFLYAVLRRRDYLLYLIYVVTMGAAVFTASDLSTLFVPWAHWALRAVIVTILLNLTTFNLVRFSRLFLETPIRAPKMDRWLRGLGWAVLAASLAFPAWLSPVTAPWYEGLDFGLNIVVLTTLPIFGLLLFFRKSPQSGLYVLAFVPTISALVAMLGENVGMPDGRSNGLPILCGNALELVFLALALGWRYRWITDEAVRLRLEYTSRLEADVASRTREVRESNESLARANRDKDRVFGIIGHDLRGPAQMLSGLAHILSANPNAFSPEESTALAKEIEDACQTQLEMLDNLIQWGRMQSGGLRVRTQAASEIVDFATSSLAQSARDKGVSVSVDTAPGLTVYADPQASQAVARNLISNALKFTPSGGAVKVTVRRRGEGVEISVQDNGVGMSAERLAEILAGPIKSLDGTRSEKGAGVGLIFCRDLARANGGDLRIESVPDRGTTATLTLPEKMPGAGIEPATKGL